MIVNSVIPGAETCALPTRAAVPTMVLNRHGEVAKDVVSETVWLWATERFIAHGLVGFTVLPAVGQLA